MHSNNSSDDVYRRRFAHIFVRILQKMQGEYEAASTCQSMCLVYKEEEEDKKTVEEHRHPFHPRHREQCVCVYLYVAKEKYMSVGIPMCKNSNTCAVWA